jgi:apolipoprotein N-acyltransferase
MLRPTGNGISAVIDERGRILARQDYFSSDSGIMLTSLPVHGIRTIYSRVGDGLAYLCAAGLVLLAALALMKRKQPAVAVPARPAIS